MLGQVRRSPVSFTGSCASIEMRCCAATSATFSFVPHAVLAGEPFVADRAIVERALDRAVRLHVAGLDHGDAVRRIQRHRRLELPLVVLERARGFVVTDEPHAALTRVRRQHRQIEVRV